MRYPAPKAGFFTERAGGAAGSTGSGATTCALEYDAGRSQAMEEYKQDA